MDYRKGKRGNIVKLYNVNICNKLHNTSSTVETIAVNDNYTLEDYLEDCKENLDFDWIDENDDEREWKYIELSEIEEWYEVSLDRLKEICDNYYSIGDSDTNFEIAEHYDMMIYSLYRLTDTEYKKLLAIYSYLAKLGGESINIRELEDYKSIKEILDLFQ